MSGAKYNRGRRTHKYHSKQKTRKPKKSKVRLIKSRKHYKNKRKTHRKRKGGGGGEPGSIEMTDLTANKLRGTLQERKIAEEERIAAEEERIAAEEERKAVEEERIAAEKKRVQNNIHANYIKGIEAIRARERAREQAATQVKYDQIHAENEKRKKEHEEYEKRIQYEKKMKKSSLFPVEFSVGEDVVYTKPVTPGDPCKRQAKIIAINNQESLTPTEYIIELLNGTVIDTVEKYVKQKYVPPVYVGQPKRPAYKIGDQMNYKDELIEIISFSQNKDDPLKDRYIYNIKVIGTNRKTGKKGCRWRMLESGEHKTYYGVTESEIVYEPIQERKERKERKENDATETDDSEHKIQCGQM
jgi:hypothetical protein